MKFIRYFSAEKKVKRTDIHVGKILSRRIFRFHICLLYTSFGAGDYKGMRGFMMNAIYLSAIFAVVMTIVTVIFCMPILELMRTPENIIDGAYRYIVIIFWGIPVTYLYNLVSGLSLIHIYRLSQRRRLQSRSSWKISARNFVYFTLP